MEFTLCTLLPHVLFFKNMVGIIISLTVKRLIDKLRLSDRPSTSHSKPSIHTSLAKTLETYIEEYCKNIVGEVFLLEIYIFMLKYFYSTKSE